MSSRQYTLTITDPLLNIKYIDINSELQPFQIQTSITYCNMTEATDMTVIEIFNFNSKLNRNNLIGCKFELIAGSMESGVLKVNIANMNALSPKLVLSGYVYDAYYDLGDMPRTKLIIKVTPYRVLKDGIESSLKKIETVVCPKNGDLFSFCSKILKNFYNIDLINASMAEMIPNKSNNIIFKFNSMNSTIIPELNQLLGSITKTVDMYEYPLCISSGPNGYMLTVDFANMTSEQIQNYISFNKMKGSDFNFAADMFADLLSYNPTNFNIDNSYLIKPPYRMDVKYIQLHTLLLPSIRIGDYITIGNKVIEGRTLVSHNPKVSNNPSIVTQSVSYTNDLNGIYVVQNVSHNLNYSDSSTTSWSTVIECARAANLPSKL